MATFENSAEANLNPSISSAVGTPVSRSALPESAGENPTLGIFGQSSLDCFAFLDPDTRSWKTSQGTFLWIRDVLRDLAELGYDAEWTCLRASDFGASHLRKRVFIVAYRDGARSGDAESERERRPASELGSIGAELAYRPSRGWRELRESSGGDGQPDGGGETLDYTASGEREGLEETADARIEREYRISGDPLADPGNGQLQEQRRGPEGRTGIGPAGENVPDARELAHAECVRREDGGRMYRGIPATPNREDGREGGQTLRERAEQLPDFAPGPSDTRWPEIIQRWPDLAPALGGRLGPRFVEFLMGFPIGYTEIKYAYATETGPSTCTVLGVRSGAYPQENQRADGRLGGIPKAEVLQSAVHGERDDSGEPVSECSPEETGASAEDLLRTLRNHNGAANPSPQGPQLEEQRSAEYPDLMQQLSHLIASCRRGDCSTLRAEAMQVLRSGELQEKCLRLLPDEDQKIWKSFADEDRATTIVEAIAWAASMIDRTKRLKRWETALCRRARNGLAKGL